MNTLKEEQLQMEREEGKRKIDIYFEALDRDPFYFMKDEKNTITDVMEYERELEKARCMRKITVFKSRLEQLYEEFRAFNMELMGDPLYSEVQEGILRDMSNAISGFYELIEHYEEEISILDYPLTQQEKDILG